MKICEVESEEKIIETNAVDEKKQKCFKNKKIIFFLHFSSFFFLFSAYFSKIASNSPGTKNPLT